MFSVSFLCARPLSIYFVLILFINKAVDFERSLTYEPETYSHSERVRPQSLIEGARTRVLIVSDAWKPQINGVVRTLERVQIELERLGRRVFVLGPDQFMTIPCPTYPEIRLAIDAFLKFGYFMQEFSPQAVHIATEGPLGIAARAHCQRNNIPFTTAFHTRFPEYLYSRFPIPMRWSYSVLRHFHSGAQRTFVSTTTLLNELSDRGFKNLVLWSRGVDTEAFHPSKRITLPYPGPIALYVGRVALEKNLEDFLKMPWEGSKVVVGGGPALVELKAKYKSAHFLGPREARELGEIYASSDVFVFPSRTDTYGLVLLEALASGVPVAAYPVPGPLDVIGTDSSVGILHSDLSQAAHRALKLNRNHCRSFAMKHSWKECALQFFSQLEIYDPIG